jgi:hypothetical protein
MVHTTEATRFELSRAAALRRDPNDPLTLQIGSHEVPVVAELRATGSRATALVELPYPSGGARRAVRQYSGATAFRAAASASYPVAQRVLVGAVVSQERALTGNKAD